MKYTKQRRKKKIKMGWVGSSYNYAGSVYGWRARAYRMSLIELVRRIERSPCTGYDVSSKGYEFDFDNIFIEGKISVRGKRHEPRNPFEALKYYLENKYKLFCIKHKLKEQISQFIPEAEYGSTVFGE